MQANHCKFIYPRFDIKIIPLETILEGSTKKKVTLKVLECPMNILTITNGYLNQLPGRVKKSVHQEAVIQEYPTRHFQEIHLVQNAQQRHKEARILLSK